MSIEPGYPETILSDLWRHVDLGWAPAGLSLAAVAIGSEQALSDLLETAPDAVPIVAVEPRRSRRERLSQRFAGQLQLTLVAGEPEELPLASASCGAVVAGPVEGRTRRSSLYTEALRVLAPGGTFSVICGAAEAAPHSPQAVYESVFGADLSGPRGRHLVIAYELSLIPSLASVQASRSDWRLELSVENVVASTHAGRGPDPREAELRRRLAPYADQEMMLRQPCVTEMVLARRA